MSFLKFIASKKGKSKLAIISDIVCSSLKYNISILDYFYFRFIDISKAERSNWAGTGYMYEYQLKMNPRSTREILNNKVLFYKAYKEFMKHIVADLEDLKTNSDLPKKLLNTKSEKLVFKVADGKCGAHVLIKDVNEFTFDAIIPFMQMNGYDIVEEYIIQHTALNELSPSGVNTVRVITQLDKNDNVVILGCRLRISINSKVDNLAAGNIAAPIDEERGIVIGPGVYSDITKNDAVVHPVTGIAIIGFYIPFWRETLNLAQKAALLHPQNRSIGWDIAIGENGPDLIEGNHDWCKLVYQLPVKKGLMEVLNNYLIQ